MAYQSRFTGAKVDELLGVVQEQVDNPRKVLDNITGADILNKMSSSEIMSKISAQDIINKINEVSGNIRFTKYVECTAGAGK